MLSRESANGTPHDRGHPNDNNNDEAVQKMFRNAMFGRWQEVANTYCGAALVATINPTEDTVLHLAASSGEESKVLLLMGKIPQERREEILKMENILHDTPLHLAAARGMSKTCLKMAQWSPHLVTQSRNENGETPLFMAARHGQKEAFGVMRGYAPYASSSVNGPVFWHNDDGDNILHVALLGEHYDLALEIIRCYHSLVHEPNKKGVLPIHILANKPSAFMSGARFSRFELLIYHCHRVSQVTIPNEGDPEERKDERGQPKQMDSEKHNQNYPNVRCRRTRRACDALFNFFIRQMRFLMFLTGISVEGLWTRVIELKKLKKIHVRSREIMIELLKRRTERDFGKAERNPSKMSRVSRLSPEAVDVRRVETTEEFKGSPEEKQLAPYNGGPVGESLILLAAKNGIKELVEYILDNFPTAVFDLDSNGKNIILLAVEHRQTHIYELMLKRKAMQQFVFGMADADGNSAAHLAAKLGPEQPQIIPGPALRMQWEVNWFKYVERSMDPEFFPQYNNKGETAQEIFMETHKDLLKDSVSWLVEVSKSCSVVAGLLASIAFVATTSLPSIGRNLGSPEEVGFIAWSSFVALFSSLMSIFMFLSFSFRPWEPWDFETDVPLRLMHSLCSLYFSVAMIACCFFARYSLLTKERIYACGVMLLPTFIFSVQLVPLYRGLWEAKICQVPKRALPTPGKRYVR